MKSADDDYSNSNDLAQANIRCRKLAETIDNLLSIMHAKGILTSADVLEVLPINNWDNQYKIN